MTAEKTRVLLVKSGKARVLRAGKPQAGLRAVQPRRVQVVGYRQGPPGRDGAGAGFGGQIIRHVETAGNDYTGRWAILNTLVANSLEVYLNGLLESHWHLEGNTLVLDATVTVGDEVSFRYFA
jgi:hypothetical protein